MDLFSSSTQRALIDAINLLFLLLFYLLLLPTFFTKHHRHGHAARSSALLLIAACCAAISALYFYSSSQSDNRAVHLLRASIWASLCASSLTLKSTQIVILTSLWWVSFFTLISAFNIRILVTNQELELNEILSWPVNLLLLLYALKSLQQIRELHSNGGNLSQPLLSEKQRKLGFFSKLTFSWITPLLRLGYSKSLILDDVPSLFSEDEANLQICKFRDSWRENLKKNERGNLVMKVIADLYKKEMIFIGIGALIKTMAVIASPLLLYALIEYSNDEDEDLKRGLILLGCMIMAKTAESLSQRHWFFQARRTGMRMRSALMAAVYEKQLRLSSSGRRRHSTGEIVNYISVDCYRMGEFPWWFHYFWTMITQLFLSIVVLFMVLGSSALPGLVPLTIFVFLNAPYAKALQWRQSELMKAQDDRLRATAEALRNMKVIKLQSWEEEFKKGVEAFREREMKMVSGLQFMKAAGTPAYWMCPTVVSAAVFAGCAALDAVAVFTVLAALRSMSEPVRMIPEALSAIIQAGVSFDRINGFLIDDEVGNGEIGEVAEGGLGKCVVIEEGEFDWNLGLGFPTLKGVNLEVMMGEKVAVCGPVGAGKSSLLFAVLKEIPKASGKVTTFGSIAYVAQTPWIQSGTIRENIIYGKPMDRDRYERAIKASALDKDINSFSHGDETEIGERGINMSGGQKQRIQLARAVYNDADIYLLDDPFSAVDAHTAATLFNDCVMAALKNKTVILVTHQVEFLTSVDKILVMEDGEIKHSGTYEDLLMAGTSFKQLVNAHNDDAMVADPPSSEITELETPPLHHHNNNIEISIKKGSDNPESSQLTEKEHIEIGNFGLKPFLDYIRISRGLPALCLATMAQLGFVVLQTASTYWLAFAIQIPAMGTAVVVGVYAAVSGLSTVFVYLRSLFSAVLGLKASKAFFSGLNDAVFEAPMGFFDSTPVGRIFTRVSSDLSILDSDIPFSIIYVIAPVTEMIAIVAVMASVTWQVLVAVAITMVASTYVQRYYMASAREIARINGTTKAPIMNYAAETSLGVTTIRAFKSEERFKRNYLKLVDDDAKLFFHTNALTEWLVLRVEALLNLTLFTATFFLLLLPKGSMTSGLVGLSLSYALTLTGTQVYLTRWYCNLSNYVVSVERIKQFMEIQPEPSAIVEGNRPSAAWPCKGRIELEDLKLRYRPNSPLVLKGITCTFHEGTRVGIVGRTGSGKTTLISALFRLTEPESGKILIDGLDICSIGLKDLRTKLSIIPQEPTLFKGSIRTNLDPLGLYSDNQIWEALEKCQLKTTIDKLPKRLDSSVSDEGENWSTGQRQLFCLGRVLLKRNKILVLDEATASIDSKTDATLQKIIREEFTECTVLTVAHRVPTVIDSDMVMVLSFGRVVEYDEPMNLMHTNSSFAKLVKEYWSSCRRDSEIKN